MFSNVRCSLALLAARANGDGPICFRCLTKPRTKAAMPSAKLNAWLIGSVCIDATNEEPLAVLSVTVVGRVKSAEQGQWLMNERLQPPTVDDYSLLAADAVVKSFRSDAERGLTQSEATRLLAQFGPNELRTLPPIPAWRRLLSQFQDPLVYLLLGAIFIALVAWLIEGRESWPIDAIVIAMVVAANAVLGFLQEARAADAVAALARMTAVTSSVLRDGERKRIASVELVPGDILLLEEGDAVGADGRLLLAASLRVREASLTGESEAGLKDATTLKGPAPLAERSCMVFKGTAVVQGTGRAVITATGMQTEMGAIATMLDATEEQPSPLQKEVALIGRTLGIAVVVIAVIVVLTVLLVSDIEGASDVITVLLLGVSLAVAAVPEGLPARSGARPAGCGRRPPAIRARGVSRPFWAADAGMRMRCATSCGIMRLRHWPTRLRFW
jgi:magnesium-transporting ATPase (P-type)